MPPSQGAQIAHQLLRRGTRAAFQRSLSTSPVLCQSRSLRTLQTSSARQLHIKSASKAQAAVAQVADERWPSSSDSTNPAMSFPCLDAQETKTATLQRRSLDSGPEPSYTTGQHLAFHSREPLLLDWGGILPELNIAYETWGTLNSAKSNAILLHTGLSASSHAHSTRENPKPGWWEKFIGPGAPLDTDKYFIICTNVIGGCYGSTGPSSADPADGRRYATRFPILTMDDMVRAQMKLIDHLGITKLAASVGASMGGMQSLAVGVHFPDRVEKIVSISGCARSHPYSIALRHTQRQALMMDPNWNRGFYYDTGIPPHMGMKLAREIATVTYRSGPEWEKRFGRKRADPSKQPALCPDFLIETYLDHAGEKFSLEYDPNSLLYISKAMDLFDLGAAHQSRTRDRRAQSEQRLQDWVAGRGSGRDVNPINDPSCSLTLPAQAYEEITDSSNTVLPSDPSSPSASPSSKSSPSSSPAKTSSPPPDLTAGLSNLSSHPILVLGVASDILFPAWQQREIADTLVATGNKNVTHVELGMDVSEFGHDTFLLDLENVGGAVGKFLS